VTQLRYAAVTPVRDESKHLQRLAASLLAQTARPELWVIVENGSRDGTDRIAAELATDHAWIRVVTLEPAAGVARGGPIVRAFHAGLDALDELGDVVVKLDADVSFDETYFERLLQAFEHEAELGVASGAAYELEDGTWVRRHMTGESAWGAARAYRRACLERVLPLEERIGWDTVDAVKAALAGWRTRTLGDLPFRHHRPEGERDGASSAWEALGRCSHFMGYRPSYQLVRTLHHVRRDRRAIGLLTGYLAAARAREAQVDPEVIRYLRDRQRARNLLTRRREAAGANLAVGTP
jgi:biofilm PGA synthesis N-glycosyltransferase PgaC